MFSRIAMLVVPLLLAVLLPGCPAQGLGVWAFTEDDALVLRGLDLQANGDAVQVSLSNANFSGTLTWERVSDTEVLIRQFSGNEVWVHYFVLTSSTMMEGARVKTEGSGAGNGELWIGIKQ